MNSLNLNQVAVVDNLSKTEFKKHFFKSQIPVVIKNLTEDWGAREKWSFEYMRKVAGERTIPLYDDRPVNYKDRFNEPHAQMKFSAYIDLLEREPTRYRIFLYNLLKEIPSLQKDFNYPELNISFLRSLPMLFFGGKDSYTFMHYDIDLANIFHFHFQGKKTCILFAPSETKFLYKVPHSLITREDIDFNDPDVNQWPALLKAQGYIAQLEHGDALYIPEGYWHYMRYITPGFSMSLRALPRKPANLTKAIYNVLIMRHLDNFGRRFIGEKWLQYKLNKAITNTEKQLQ
jgi:hypothetical protein